jgi:hypothetical protein
MAAVQILQATASLQMEVQDGHHLNSTSNGQFTDESSRWLPFEFF